MKGSAAYMVQGQREIPFVYIDEGDIFGELDIITDKERRAVGAKALKDCEILVLKKSVNY